MRYIAFGLLLAVLSSLIVGQGTIYAESDVPPTTDTVETFAVQGRIVNKTMGGTVPADVPVMIHAWDKTGTERVSLSGVAAADNTFRFEGVPFNPSWLYGVMALYEDVAYFTDLFNVDEGQSVIEREVSIYESTSDASTVVIERLHIFFDVTPTGVEVTEVYVISNTGERTVKEAVTLKDGTKATLVFPLPPNASNVQFQESMPGEFVSQPGGFADLAPLIPNKQRQVFVSYTLPYVPNMTYRHVPRYPIKGITTLVPSVEGIKLQGEGVVFAGQRTTRDGLSVDVYTAQGIRPGQSLTITLMGTPKVRVGNTTGQIAAKTSDGIPWDVVAGGIFLGVVLIGAGVWWTRHASSEEDIPTNQAFLRVVDEIVRLDEAHARGEVADDVYREQRKRLQQKARLLFTQQQSIPDPAEQESTSYS